MYVYIQYTSTCTHIPPTKIKSCRQSADGVIALSHIHLHPLPPSHRSRSVSSIYDARVCVGHLVPLPR